MNYISRYGLEFNPFLKNSKEILVETSEYKEIIYRLTYLLETRGFGVITGRPGMGKTTTIRNWSKGLNKSLYKVIYISLSTVTTMEFYRQLAAALDIEPAYKKVDNFKAIQTEINRLTLEKRITPIIILDEANYINNSILNDLKIIFNFDMDSKDRAIVLFVGLPQLNNTLRLTANEPLRQRITMNYHIDGLNKLEAKNYIDEKLKNAGCTQEVFEPSTYDGIINASNGSLRIINKICNECLLLGNNKEMNTINNDIVMMAVEDIELA